VFSGQLPFPCLATLVCTGHQLNVNIIRRGEGEEERGEEEERRRGREEKRKRGEEEERRG
jgi:hypothetical protein